MNIVTETRIAGDATRTRFIADLTDGVETSVFALADPYRIVIDLPEVHFRLAPEAGKTGRGLVSAYRYGLISRGKSRIVLDVASPAAVDKTFVVPAANGQPARLVVDLVATTREAFLAEVRAGAAAEPPAAAEPAIADNDADGRLRVVIDPGHGGIDAGAIGVGGTREKDLVLAFAQTLAAQLQASGRYDVAMTRTDDTFVPLGARVRFARSRQADLFISIHANSFFGGSVRGATVYTLSDKASDRMAADVAAVENQSDVLAGVVGDEAEVDDVRDILLDLTRRETKNFGVVFARNLIEQLGQGVRMFKIPHQQAGFRVLEAPDVPSALIELGYLSNAEDEKLMNTPSWRDHAAGLIVKAIDSYFATRVAQRGQ